MKRYLFVIISTQFLISCGIGPFGFKNAEECYKEIVNKIKFEDAEELLSDACFIGYEKNARVDKSFKSSGRCIVGQVDDIYSYETALKVINSCTNKVNEFQSYSAALYSNQRRREEELKSLIEENTKNSNLNNLNKLDEIDILNMKIDRLRQN